MSPSDAAKKILELSASAAPGPWWRLNNYGTEILDPASIFGECGIIAEGTTAFIGQAYRANCTDEKKLDNNLKFIAETRILAPVVAKRLLELESENANLKIICRMLTVADSLKIRDRIANQCIRLYTGNILRESDDQK